MNRSHGGARRSLDVIATWYPEVGAGGYTSLDGTVEFYGRVQSLARPEMHVLDFGAGRGSGLQEDPVPFRRDLRLLRGKVAKVVACDVDDAVLSNPGADETVVIEPGQPLPFGDNTFDLIVSDYVFEHIADPSQVSEELSRILKPGGWICARTPNKYCLISLATRAINNSQHARLLRWAQPERKSIDVFPTVFRLNSKRDINRWFDGKMFENFTFRYEPEPAYFFNRKLVFWAMLLVNFLVPPVMKSGLFVFLQKKQDSSG